MFTLPLMGVFIRLSRKSHCNLALIKKKYNLSLAYWMNSFIPCTFSEWEGLQAALAAVLKMVLADKKN